MTSNEIREQLPHRWPFLLVDKVTKLTKNSIEGYKNISNSDIVFVGHFPEIPIYPGVMIVESLAQISGLLLSNQEMIDPKNKDNSKIGFLTSIKNFKFIKTVQPGDQLFLKSILKGGSGECYIFAVTSYVDNIQIGTGEIQLFLQEKERVL